MKTLLLFLIFISYTYAYVNEEALASLQTLDHWNTFRIVIPHTTDECFFLETKLNDTIHAIYQVLKGGDSQIRATINNPLGQTVFAHTKNSFGWYDEEHVKVSGTYRICFTNEQYFTTKIIYIGVLAVHRDLILEANILAAQEQKMNSTAIIDEFSVTVMKSLGDISSTLYRLTAYQTISRVHETHDLYAVEDNASYVQNWAICQMITMITCSLVQVFSIRRLFKSTISNKTSSYKKSNQDFNSQTFPHFIITN